MAQKQVKIDEKQHEQLQELYRREGVTIAESVRRAIREYLERRREKREGKE